MTITQSISCSKSWFLIGREGWILVVGSGFNRFGQFMSLPFLALYLSSTSELSNTYIGIIVACGPLAGVISGFYGGALSDYFPRKLILISSSAFVTLSYVLFFYLSSPIYLALTNLVFGMATAVFEPVLMAVCRSEGEKKKIQKAMMLRYTSINISAAIAPLIGGYFATSDNSNTVFLISGVISFFLLVSVNFLKVSPHGSKPSKTPNLFVTLKVVLLDRKFTLYVIAFTLILFSYAFTNSTLSLQLLQQYGSANDSKNLFDLWSGYWSHSLSGAELFTLLLVINALSVLAFQAPMTYLFQYDDTLHKFLKSGLLMSLGYALLILPLNNYHLLVIAMVILCAGESVMFPVTTILTDDSAPESKRGSYYGAAGFKKLGFVLAPPIGGWLLDNFSPSVLWSVACFSSLLPLGICLYANKLSKLQ